MGFFGEVVRFFGISKSWGRIYGTLDASPLPLGFSDIVERLGISKGSVGQGLPGLQSLGAIHEVELGVTTEVSGLAIKRCALSLYKPELCLRRLVSGVRRERIAPFAAAAAYRLRRLDQLAEQAPRDKELYSTRAEQLKVWRKRFKTVLPVLIALFGSKREFK